MEKRQFRDSHEAEQIERHEDLDDLITYLIEKKLSKSRLTDAYL
jgi:hypothetical protein